ncbi:MAG TPA: hypothetical protein VGE21_02440 [Flavobacteriales bacterium]
MDIRAALANGHSKELSERIARYVGDDPERFGVLMEVLRNGTPELVQRAAWCVGMVCVEHPELATPWVGSMLDLLDRPMHAAVHRNIIRTFQFCELPEVLHGRLTDVMFAWINDATRAIACRAFAITVALRLAKLYPDLGRELRSILELVLRDDPGPAIRSRGGKALRSLGFSR